MRSPLTRPEAALAGLAGLVLLAGCASALALADDDDRPAAAGGTARSAAPDPSASRQATPSASASSSASAGAGPSTTSPVPQESPADAAMPPVEPEPAPAPAPAPAPEQRPPEQVALTFFDAAVQGRDADALAVAEAQALSDLREYEAWQSHRLTGCQPEKGHSVCVLEAESTFLRLILTPDAATGWRVQSVE